ncbi:MAG: hypothetical protein GZ089_05845 [Aromatoleum sp.]|nr:hypothetical protein [Aromatoleum sp.]
MSDVAARAAFAKTLARKAGALGRRYFRRELAFAPQEKGPQDWISAADLAVDDLIRGELARVFPDDAMPGEEGGISGGPAGGASDALWAVDPIDGAINFIHGVRYWCVSIVFTVDGAQRP